MVCLAVRDCRRFGLILAALLLAAGVTRAEPRRYALVVGVKEYPVSEKLPDLTHPEADAELLAGTLTNSGYQVTLMTRPAAQGDGNGRFLPTAALIRKRFEALVNLPFLKPEDCLVVTLAGHGIQLASRTDPEQKTYYFCPADADIDRLKFSEEVGPEHNLISVPELYALLQKSAAGVKLLAVDACRNDPSQPPLARAPHSVTRPPVPVPPGGIAAFFSCSADQQSIEDPALKHGVFTYYLNEALCGRGDANQDSKVTLAEIKEYVGLQVYAFVEKKYGRSQLPEMEDKTRGLAAVIDTSRILAGVKAGDLWDRNSLRMPFCWCPPGDFTMGSPASELHRSADEGPVNVTLSRGFWMGRLEVTQAEYEAVAGDNPSRFNRETLQVDTGRYPVERVSWEEAMEFCRRLTARERAAGRLPAGWEYTLPTEAQWEYACRAGTTTATAFGNSLGSTQANFEGTMPYNGAAEGVGLQRTVAVGSYKANAWNLHDMHGNVMEWCRDRRARQLPGGTDPEVQEKSVGWVCRGGAYDSYGTSCRAAHRWSGAPGTHFSYIGFRLALVPVR